MPLKPDLNMNVMNEKNSESFDMHNKFMEIALSQAELSLNSSDVPVGAVIVKEGKIIGRGFNTREFCGDGTAHAEINAIREACKNIGGWRLYGCTIYVTLEPCPMCMGAIVNSRVSKVVFGVKDPKAGACGSVIDFNSYPLNHKPEIIGGVEAEKCSRLLSEFFEKRRKTGKSK